MIPICNLPPWALFQRPALETLVPAYLDSVPLDPFTQKPMPYDPAKALLYCAGPKLIEDGGAYAFAKDADPFDNHPFIILSWAQNTPL